MSSRLSSDGAKIKALRIQRGWTQEQLAEIAGVSARTVQRAETSGRAAFDTLRAVAGAFETDFNQLLRTDPRQKPEPGFQSVPPLAQAAVPIPASCERAALPRSAQQVPRKWTMFSIGAAALAGGLLSGGILVYRFSPRVERNVSTSRPGPAIAGGAGAGEESNRPIISAVEIPRVPPTAKNAVNAATIPIREPGPAAGKPEYPHPVAAAEAIPAADLGPRATMSAPVQSAFFELPLPRKLPPILVTSEMPDRPASGLADSVDLAPTDQAAGVVRRSIGQAAKKTGDAIAKVSASIWRVF